MIDDFPFFSRCVVCGACPAWIFRHEAKKMYNISKKSHVAMGISLSYSSYVWLNLHFSISFAFDCFGTAGARATHSNHFRITSWDTDLNVNFL